jgi:hypothetical protein
MVRGVNEIRRPGMRSYFASARGETREKRRLVTSRRTKKKEKSGITTTTPNFHLPEKVVDVLVLLWYVCWTAGEKFCCSVRPEGSDNFFFSS